VPGSADEKGAARYRLRLFSIAYGMTGSVGDAEDTEVNCRQIFARAGSASPPGTRPASSPTARAGRVRQRPLDYCQHTALTAICSLMSADDGMEFSPMNSVSGFRNERMDQEPARTVRIA